MAETERGPRSGKQDRLAVGCSAVIVDPAILSTSFIRRVDTGRWRVLECASLAKE